MFRKILTTSLFTLALTFFACTSQTSDQTTNTDQMPKDENKTAEMQTMPAAGDAVATIKTTKGDIKILLYTKFAPETTRNFVELANAGKYNDVLFHRVIKDFMIQTGDFENNNGTGGYTYQGPGTTLVDEFGEGLMHVRGAVSMANRGPNTGASQFFIVQAEGGTPWLDGVHAIFGYAYEGMDVVDAIANVDADAQAKPLEDIKIQSVEISQYQ